MTREPGTTKKRKVCIATCATPRGLGRVFFYSTAEMADYERKNGLPCLCLRKAYWELVQNGR